MEIFEMALHVVELIFYSVVILYLARRWKD